MGCKSSKVTPSDNFFSRQALWIKEFAMFHLVGTASRKESCHCNPINTPMRSLGAALKGTWDQGPPPPPPRFKLVSKSLQLRNNEWATLTLDLMDHHRQLPRIKARFYILLFLTISHLVFYSRTETRYLLLVPAQHACYFTTLFTQSLIVIHHKPRSINPLQLPKNFMSEDIR
jgi:hypothetical protein